MERKGVVEKIAKVCREALLHYFEDDGIDCGDISDWKDANFPEDFRADFTVKLKGKNYTVLVRRAFEY